MSQTLNITVNAMVDIHKMRKRGADGSLADDMVNDPVKGLSGSVIDR
jgi:hypothetical protein